MENSKLNSHNFWYKIESCKKIIQEEYDNYKKEKWEKVHYNDGDFFDLVEKNSRITVYYEEVFLFAYQKFLEEHERNNFQRKVEKN
jgi:hypothetical protein